MTQPNIPALLVDLQSAASAAKGERPCPLCEYLDTLEPGALRSTLEDAAAGTIGIRKLEHIFQAHDIPVGRRTIVRHRNERHGAQ